MIYENNITSLSHEQRNSFEAKLTKFFQLITKIVEEIERLQTSPPHDQMFRELTSEPGSLPKLKYSIFRERVQTCISMLQLDTLLLHDGGQDLENEVCEIYKISIIPEPEVKDSDVVVFKKNIANKFGFKQRDISSANEQTHIVHAP